MMSKIDELIQQYCPNGVEYKTLGEVFQIQRGERVTKKQLNENGTYPVFQNSLSPLGYFEKNNRRANTPFIIIGGAAGNVGYSYIDFWAADDCLTIDSKNDATNRYIFYILTNRQPFLLSQVRKSSVPRLSRSVIDTLSIPVPPLPVQEEIVRILDKFTTLEAELEAELDCRKRQYEYYRSKLLSFNNLTRGGGISQQVKWVKMSEIAEIKRGGNFQKKDFIDNGFPCIHYGQIYTHFGIYTDSTLTYLDEETFNKSKKAVQNDIIMTVTSENVEDVCKCVAWLGKEEIAVSGHTAIIHHSQNAKFLSYYFHTDLFMEQKKKLAHGTKVIEITPNRLNDILIPLPPLSEQERIVAILDRFDALVNDISIGLPAEIKARRKQYEYYRNKLLAFPEHKTAA